MKICFLSDTHGSHRGVKQLPDADVICHTGDYSAQGSSEDLKQFMKWFSGLEQYSARIFISGNHDIFAEESPDVMESMIPKNVIYLRDSFTIIDGYKFYGTPYQPIFLNWAFNLPEEELVKKWEMIPDDTDILLTHCPPYGVLDFAEASKFKEAEHCGSRSLLDRVLHIDPLAHAFGHIHEAYGEISLYNNTSFVNGSLLNRRYQLVNDPIIINAVKNETTNRHRT